MGSSQGFKLGPILGNLKLKIIKSLLGIPGSHLSTQIAQNHLDHPHLTSNGDLDPDYHDFKY